MVRLYPRGVATRPEEAWTHQSLQFSRPTRFKCWLKGASGADGAKEYFNWVKSHSSNL